MGDELQWLASLVKDYSPEQGKQSPPEEWAPPTVPGERKLQFTVKDWELLSLLVEAGQWIDLTPSNAELGKILGLGNGAVSARIKRLSKMGLIHVVHLNATDTGQNNARIIRVMQVPPRPWSPS